MTKRSLVACAAAALLLIHVPRASAQAIKGELLGNIVDAGGLALPGVTVTITEVNTNISYTKTTNESGYYTFPSLKDGTYKVVAEVTGFKKTVRDGIIVDVNTTVRVDLKMEIGAVEESITVQGESPVLQTDRTDTGRVIESKMVTDLPLIYNRNFQSLYITVPGATRPHREHSAFFNSQDSLSTEVNGQSRLANNMMIEGLDDNQKTGLLQVIIPAADALETVSITTSNYDAEFGRSGGAITNVVLRSGTNTYKGTGFFFGNNQSTNAGDYFSHQKPPTKFMNGGFTLGGPIKHNKVFFFGDYQRTIDNLGRVNRSIVPTEAMRGGDFSAVAQHIYDPTTGDIGGNNRVPFDGNIILPYRISSIAQNLLKFIPLPNIPGAPLGQINFQQAQTRDKTTDGFDTKVNYTMSAKDQVSARLSFMRPVVFDPGQFGQYGGPANGGFAGTGKNTAYSGAGTWTRTLSPSMLLDVRGGLNYYHNTTVTTGDGLTTSTDVGIPGANLDRYTSGVSTISISGYGDPLLGFVNSQPWDRSEKTWNIVSSLTKMKANHTIKMGGEWRKNTDKLLQTQDTFGPRGGFHFSVNGTGTPADASRSGLANSFAAFLLDWPDQVRRDLKVIDAPGTKHWAIATFIQDKWQARSNVTLDLGLRWEFYKPLEGNQGAGSLSTYDPTTGTLRVAGYGNMSNSLNVKNYYKNINPRVGATWRLDEKTVVRGGYGASTIPFPDNRYAYDFPVKQNYQGALVNGFQNAGSMAQGFPAPAPVNIPSDGAIPLSGPLVNSVWDVIPTTLHEGTLHSWNVAFQRQLPYGFTGDIAYVGSKGAHLVMDVDLNASQVYNSGNAGRPENVAPLFRQGTSRERSNLGKSRYNGLQMKVDRRFINGLLVTNSYTFGRSKDLAQENGGIGTPIDFNQSWGRSDTDRTHNYVATAVYELPWGSKKRWLNEGTLGKIIGGWQLSGIYVWQSGLPLSITASGTLLNTPGTTAYANLNGQQSVLAPAPGSPHSASEFGLGPGLLYFDPSVYSQPAAGTQGNMTRHTGVDGPAYWEIDSSLFKRFPLGGTKYGEFRVDSYNVTNSVRWGNPNTGVDFSSTSTFGQIQNPTGSQRTFRFGVRFGF
jgi:hypothetical protein